MAKGTDKKQGEESANTEKLESLNRARAIASGNDVRAMRIASKWFDLGKHKEAITRGWAAHTNSAFYKQIGKDPESLLLAGIAALKQRIGYAEP
jgi:hypothetical protein